MDETKYAKAFELIMNAGNAKSLALMAVESAREFDFEEAQKQLKESQQEFHLAHQAQHNAQEFINLYRLVKELQDTVNELKGGNEQ